MRVIIDDYESTHNIICLTSGCKNKATFVASNAVGDRARACDEHIGQHAAALARFS